jgi:hypothetical protein
MRYETKWTAEAIKDFRIRYTLSQGNLALLLRTQQQRVGEWEKGLYQMRRRFSEAMTALESDLHRIKNRCKGQKSFIARIKQRFGVELKEQRCKKLSRDGRKKKQILYSSQPSPTSSTEKSAAPPASPLSPTSEE